MPVVSKNQNAAMHAAAQGQSTLGIPKNVGQKFVAASHGMNVKALPQQVAKKKPKKSGKLRRNSEHWS
jgi:hypothetical protein